MNQSILHNVNSLIKQNELLLALNVLEEAIQANSCFYLYHLKMADILFSLKEFDKAIGSLQEAIQLRPDMVFLQKKLSLFTRALPTNDKPYLKNSNLLTNNTTNENNAPICCGIYEKYPDLTGKRKLEGGIRLHGKLKASTKSRPLISIITVVYNNQDSLERCIKSVLSQSYDNIEYIIIDGGSTQPTRDIINKYKDKIDYFISEPDKGIYDAMNKGIALSQGEYICLINSDDYYDPQFAKSLIMVAQREQSSAVFCHYNINGEVIKQGKVNDGITFSLLNINHSAFMAHRNCYNAVGPYSEDFRIVSDFIWIRNAYKKGIHFTPLTKNLLTFTEGGLSSGNSPERKNLIISEIVQSYLSEFKFLNDTDAKAIYLFRFNNQNFEQIETIINKYSHEKKFLKSLAGYVGHCFYDRQNFKLPENSERTLFLSYIKLCNLLDIPKSVIRMPTQQGCFSKLISTIDNKFTLKKPNSTRVILHFVSIFSAPSETFIYDLLSRLENDTAFDNFILFDQRKLDHERPYNKSLCIPWENHHKEVRNVLYQHIFETLAADIVISHFALNNWKLDQRIKPLGIQVPTICMTHGIDVFMLKTKGEYQNHILADYALRKNAFFSTVSKYLRNHLIEAGVDQNKISLIHNTIHPRFYANRKKSGYRTANDPVKLLAVGRLIGLKGHRFLIKALAIVKEKVNVGISLSIVFGNGDELLEEITQQIKTLKLEENIKLIPFVDFETNPHFYSNFDMFIHPSTYSDDSLHRSESFGMSVLEAIASGLPVIVTDAGGVPEVIGGENEFAQVVPHANSKAMATTIINSIQDSSCFLDNSNYAESRLALFSEKSQILQLSKLIYKTCDEKLKAAIFSSSTMQGAGYAAYRLHRGLLETNSISTEIFTTIDSHKGQDGVSIISPPPHMSWRALQPPSISKPNLTIFTVNHPILKNRRLSTLTKNVDVINIHWGARFLSIENIAHLSNMGKPVVITVRDMHPLTGGCHFFHGCNEWLHSCKNCPQLVNHWNQFPSKVLKAKRKYYNFKNITMVALSKHTANIIRQAPYFKDCRLEVIPNSIETDIFKPLDKVTARKAFNLPLNRKIIGYIPSFSSEVKGYNEIHLALKLLDKEYKHLNPLIMLVGNKTPATKSITLDLQSLGYISDNKILAKAYSAADVIVVPSLEETFSNTTAESISCGTPVVGFKTGAIPELVIDGVTGFSYPVGDVKGLANGIHHVLTGPNLSKNCRQHAEGYLQFNLQSKKYEKLFIELVTFNQSNDSHHFQKYIDFFPETTPTIVNLLNKNHKTRKVLFLGFSVTNDPISYVNEFIKNYSKSLNISKTKCKAIGGITPLLLRYLITDEMLEDSEIIILELATSDANTLYSNERNEYAISIYSILATIISKGKIPILLDLPRSDIDYSSDWVTKLHKCIADYFNILRIDCIKTIDNSKPSEAYLRDVVHPTKIGAQAYAKLIYLALQENNLKKYLSPKIIPRLASLFESYHVTNLCTGSICQKHTFKARRFKTSYLALLEDSSITIKFKQSKYLRGITYIMGPASGELLLNNDLNIIQKIITYDTYCYYERLNGTLFNPIQTSSISIKQTSKLPQIKLRKGEPTTQPRLGKIAHVLIDQLPKSEYIKLINKLPI